MAEDENHVESHSWDDDDGADIGKDHLWLLTRNVEHCSHVHLGHVVRFPIIGGHGVTSDVERHYDNRVEDCDDEEKDGGESQENEVESVVCAANCLQLIVIQVPESLEPVEHVLDAVAPGESYLAASTSSTLILVVDVGFVEHLLENYATRKKVNPTQLLDLPIVLRSMDALVMRVYTV